MAKQKTEVSNKISSKTTKNENEKEVKEIMAKDTASVKNKVEDKTKDKIKSKVKDVEKNTDNSSSQLTSSPNEVPKTPFVHKHIEAPSYGISGKEGALESNEVYDEADIASALEAGFIAQALERHKEKVAPEKHPDFDGEHCVDCLIKIPEVRLEMGKVRCVHCQTELEKINKMQGRY